MPEEIIPKKKLKTGPAKPEKGEVQKDVEQIIKKTAEEKTPEIAQKRNRVKSIVSFAVFAIFLILLAFSAGFSFWKIIKESNNFLSAKNQITVLASQSVDVENFKNNYDNYKANFEKIEAMFLDQQNPLDFIKFLEESAVLAKIDISISPPSFTQEGGQKLLSIQVSCSGTLDGELKFLEAIEKGPYLVSSQNLAFTNLQPAKTGQKEEAGQPRATFLLRALSR